MRRSVVFVVVTVIGLLLASAVPAGGAPAEKDEYLGIECFVADFTEAEFRPAGNTIHIRGGEGTSDEYIWFENAWVWVGENQTVINSNENTKNETAANWGTFMIDLGDIGEFEGSWANGVARGKATDDSGKLLKTDLAPDLGEWPEDAANMENWPECETDPNPDDFVFYLPPLPVVSTVINPHA